ncbi:TIGR04222 domain-containing membrane protein [Streptomyces bambusae]|uniref:TIGR04222 domain-containing membrane protein n=1 Tax=Streptomyces bambusae TaxID=1550616 RepID=UPI001CFC7156|nr:TIGR04222 domain-containing membrane protein [Streptomyces bambusae]MCB5164556.1 TIGR04222 domain-containing membrane protein [Streptomyces bambusae]
MWQVAWGTVYIVLGVVLVRQLRSYAQENQRRIDPPVREPADPDLYVLAALSGGGSRVADTALAAMFLDGRLTSPAGGRVLLADAPGPDAVQQAAVEFRAAGGDAQDGPGLLAAVRQSAAVADVLRELAAGGLLDDPEAGRRTRAARARAIRACLACAVVNAGVCAADWAVRDRVPLEWTAAYALLWVCGFVALWYEGSKPDLRPLAARKLSVRLSRRGRWTRLPGQDRLDRKTAATLTAVARRGTHALPALQKALTRPYVTPSPSPRTPSTASHWVSGGGVGLGGADFGGGGCGGGCGGGL